MKITNRTGLPQVIVDAVQNDPYDPGDADYTCTGLLKPPRAMAISRAHWEEVEEDAADRLWALLGSALHVILERANKADAIEERLYAEIDGLKISGRFDRVDVSSGELQDFKTTSAWSRVYGSNDADWERQLNVLAFLANMNGYHIKSISILALYRDHAQRDLEKDKRGTYPRAPIERIEFKLWSKKETLAFIRKRIALHEAAKHAVESGQEPEECDEQERWWSAKAKRSNRCERYCSAAPWCSQHQREMRESGEEEL